MDTDEDEDEENDARMKEGKSNIDLGKILGEHCADNAECLCAPE